jgi:hypothetical protein
MMIATSLAIGKRITCNLFLVFCTCYLLTIVIYSASFMRIFLCIQNYGSCKKNKCTFELNSHSMMLNIYIFFIFNAGYINLFSIIWDQFLFLHSFGHPLCNLEKALSKFFCPSVFI